LGRDGGKVQCDHETKEDRQKEEARWVHAFSLKRRLPGDKFPVFSCRCFDKPLGAATLADSTGFGLAA
jgi:hypothetical protein